MVVISNKFMKGALKYFGKSENDIMVAHRDTIYPTNESGVYIYIGTINYIRLYMTRIQRNYKSKIVWGESDMTDMIVIGQKIFYT